MEKPNIINELHLSPCHHKQSAITTGGLQIEKKRAPLTILVKYHAYIGSANIKVWENMNEYVREKEQEIRKKLINVAKLNSVHNISSIQITSHRTPL